MNNLETILTIAACLAGMISMGMIIYFGGRIWLHFYIRSKLGDMPSAEEIAELYESINSTYKERSLLDQRTYYEKLDK